MINLSGEAAGEVRYWSLLVVKWLQDEARVFSRKLGLETNQVITHEAYPLAQNLETHPALHASSLPFFLIIIVHYFIILGFFGLPAL